MIATLRTRIPPLWLDGGLAGLVLVVQLWPLLTRVPPDGVAWHWWGYAAACGASLPLVVRRLAPITVAIVTTVFSGMYDLADHAAPQPVWYGPLLAMYTVAAHCAFLPRIAIAAVTLAGGALTVGSSDTLVRGTVLGVAAYALGRASAASRAHAAELEEKAERLEHARRLEAERAAERERARIARDMHDILAHAVALMVVQAEAGPVVVRTDPGRAERAFDAIAETGRDAMVQLRRLLGVLKEEPGQAGLEPQPTLDGLDALVEQVPGVTVVLTRAGEPGGLTPDGEVAAYRIVQEALTNVVKHSGATRAVVRLEWENEDLMLSIIDNGAGAAPPSGGHGLIGIRERAAACGGSATAGPRGDGRGFEVLVRLPLNRPTTRPATEAAGAATEEETEDPRATEAGDAETGEARPAAGAADATSEVARP